MIKVFGTHKKLLQIKFKPVSSNQIYLVINIQILYFQQQVVTRSDLQQQYQALLFACNNIIKFLFKSFMRILVILTLLLSLKSTLAQTLYNHNSATYRNQSWMSLFDDGIPLRQMSIIGTHSSLSTGVWGDAFQTQASSLTVQMEAGFRALDIRCRHKNDKFRIHQRLIDLGLNFDDVLNTVQSFLASYPGETILMHVVQEYDPTGNSRSFQQTFIMYRDMFPNLIWSPTTQNPTLGMTRGKVVIIQNFVGAIHGLLYGSFTTIEHKSYSTNWDQHDRWINIKNFMADTNTAGSSRISFWTGSVGSFPYFVASGKSSPGNNAGRLATGLTTPGFSSYYPDFPRVACFIGICTIAFEGINILGYNYYTSNSFQYLGIIFTDFAGDTLISSVIQINSDLFGVCTTTQRDEGCIACSKAGNCLGCDEDLHYAFDSANQICIAAIGYYLNSSYIPESCSDAMPGCLQCSSEIVCTLCDTYANYQLVVDDCEAADGFYLDASFVPVACSIQGCFTCSSASVCTNCSEANNFIMDINGDCVCDSAGNFVLLGSVCVCDTGYFLASNGTCQSIPLCPDPNSGCITCVSSVCQVCDAANFFTLDSPYCVCQSGFFYDGAGCDQCNNTMPACQECISDSICTLCTDNFTLSEGVCACSVQYYQFDSDTCLQCPIGCLQCSSDSACTTCDTDAFFKLVGGICQCETGMFVKDTAAEVCVPCSDIVGCIECDMSGCLACDTIFGFTLNGTECFCSYGQYVSTMNVCTQCRMQGCMDCDSETNCLECDTSIYYLQSGSCLQICGDGVLYSLECDDGNTVDGDGCSSECFVEEDYTCSGGSSMSPSACSFSGEISLALISFVKNPYENKVTAILKIQPSLKAFEKVDFEKSLVTNFPTLSNTTTYSPDTNQITYVFTYDESLNDKDDMELTFDPPDTLQFYYTNQTKLGMPSNTDNNLGLKAYDAEVYQQVYNLEIVAKVLAYLTIGVFFFGLFFSSKLIGVQMIEIVQFGYLGLIIVDKLEALLYPFTQLWPINGYNLIIQSQVSLVTPSRVFVPGYKNQFLANFSLNFLFAAFPLIIGVILLIISKTCLKADEKTVTDDYEKYEQHKKVKRMSYRLMKQWELTGLLLVQFHLTASIVFAIIYGSQVGGIVGGGILLAAFLVMIVLFIKKPLNFGEYKKFFENKSRFSLNYYVWIILWRIGFVSGVAALNYSQACGYYAIGFTALQFLFLVIIRPYKSNLRPIINSILMILIAIIYTIYRVQITNEAQWITTYLPIILLSVLFAAVVFNLIFMILYIRKKCKKAEDKKSNKEIEAIELEMATMTKRQLRQQFRIASPQGAQSYDNPNMNLMKNLKSLQLKPNKISKDRDYMKEYDAI